jgi:formate dehydrogenase maturation protein FdhE
MTGIGKVGRNDPCPCGSGRKVKQCCGVQRGPSEEDVARAFLSELFEDARGVLQNVSESEFMAMGQAWCMRAATYPELRVRLPDDSPAVERLKQALVAGDKRGLREPFEEVLEEVDTPQERARLVHAVHALMDDGVVDVTEAAVAALELSTVSRELLRAWLMDAMEARIKRAGHHRHDRRAGLRRQQRVRVRRSHPPRGPASG